MGDYRDLNAVFFDHITSVGMVEHVGKTGLDSYFNKIQSLLSKNGTALVHGITRQQGGAVNAWLDKYIFPGGYIPGLVEMTENITDKNLQIIDLESLRRDYQLTLQLWQKNFKSVREEVINMKSETFYRMWDLYLQACASGFEAGNIDVIQFLLVKPANNVIPMRRV